MPACRLCGKQKSEGTTFCGSCAASLVSAKPPKSPPPIPPDEPSPKPTEPPTLSIQGHEIRKQAPPRVFKPESKVRPAPASFAPPIFAPPIDGKRKGSRVELLPWSELSASQKGGRAAAGVVV